MRYRIHALSAVAAVTFALLTCAVEVRAAEVWAVVRAGGVAGAERPAVAPQTTGRRRRATRKRRQASSTTPAKTGGTTTGQSTGGARPQQQAASQPTNGPLSGVSYELPIRTPGAGEERAQGMLTSVACDNAGVTFNVTAGGRTLRLRTPDLNAVKFMTFTPEVSGEVTCGARNNNVVVIYRPTKGARYDGTLLVVQFVPRDFVLKQ